MLAARISLYYILKYEPHFDLMCFSIYSTKPDALVSFVGHRDRLSRGRYSQRDHFQGYMSQDLYGDVEKLKHMN